MALIEIVDIFSMWNEGMKTRYLDTLTYTYTSILLWKFQRITRNDIRNNENKLVWYVAGGGGGV